MSSKESNDKDDEDSEYQSYESDDEKENINPYFENDLELENKNPGTERNLASSLTSNLGVLYCKARGMSLDHISSNSILHFKPSEENLHGAELFCSHSGCKAKGVKFRYCAHCKKAVAKRNFRNRHAHLGLTIGNGNESRCQRTNTCDTQINFNASAAIAQKQMQHTHYRSTLGDITQMSTNSFSFSNAKGPIPQNKISSISTSKEINMNHFYIPPRPLPAKEEPIPSAWIDLYRNRPTSGKFSEVSVWQQQVMSFLSFSPRINGGFSHVSSEASTVSMNSNPVRAVKQEFEGMTFRYHPNLHVNTENLDYDNISLLDSKGSVISFPYSTL
jgi:hypothetical protein